MKGKRFVFCIKGMNKSLLFTDTQDDRSLEDIETGLSKIFCENKFISFRTPTDLIIARSTDLSAISVQELGVPDKNSTNVTKTTNRLTDKQDTPTSDISDQILNALDIEDTDIEEENIDEEERLIVQSHPEILSDGEIQKLLDEDFSFMQDDDMKDAWKDSNNVTS